MLLSIRVQSCMVPVFLTPFQLRSVYLRQFNPRIHLVVTRVLGDAGLVSCRQVLPLAHTSGSNRDEVQLVNPQGVNLKAYEARLETAIGDYTR